MANNNGKGNTFQSDYSRFGRTEADSKTIDQQRRESVENFTQSTVSAYKKMYGDIKKLHKDDFLANLEKDETKTIENISKAYKSMFDEVSKYGSEKLSNIVSANTASSSNTTSSASALTNTNLGAIEKLLKEIVKNTATGGSSSNDGSSGIGTPRHRYREEETGQTQLEKSFIKVGDKTTDILTMVSNSLVQGRESQRVVGFGIKSLEHLVDLVSAFRDQEKMADSIVGIVVMLLKEVLGFITDAMMDHYNTQEEIFTNYMIYMKNSDRNLGFLTDEQKFRNRLAELDLENNIKVTDLMRLSVDLASKGLSADRARDAALDTAIYKVIAPALNTSSDIFLDLQTRGLKNVTDSMAGIVESVRSTAGSSRVAMATLNTVVEKLGPIELYAQKGLLSGDAAQMLSDLEQMGYTTADAMEIVNTVIDAYSDPYKALTGGSTMAKLLAEQYASGSLTTLTGGKNALLNYLSMFTSGLAENDIVDRSALYSAIGLNISPWLRQTGEGGTEQVEDPAKKYNEMLASFGADEYQTFNELQTIAVTNTDIAMGMNTYVREIGDRISTIVQGVINISNFLTGGNLEKQMEIKNAYDAAVETAKSDKTTVGKLTALSQLSEALSLDYNAAGTSAERKEELMAQYATIQEQYAKYKSQLSPWEQQGLTGLSSMNWWTSEDFAGSPRDYRTSLTSDLPNMLAYEAGTAAKGAYLTQATPLIAGEAGPEFVIPEQTLIDKIGDGFDQYLANRSITPDYTVIVSAIYNVASEIVTAINNNGGNVRVSLDTTTGLMTTNKSNTNLNPIMGK